MKKIIKCENCGEEIGQLVKINYPADSSLGDKIDYDLREFNNYGGETDEGHLCCCCFGGGFPW